MFRPLVPFSALALFAAGCGCGETLVVNCTSDSECSGGAKCVMGKCGGGNTGGGAGGGSATGGGSGGGTTIVTGCNPTDPNNATRDTDCDGISDRDEYMISYNGNAHTDPCNSDSDMDGIADGVEMGRTSSPGAGCGGRFVADAEPGSKTDPTNNDSDGDGVLDGAEDKNHDGKLDPGESNPLKRDSDCDGIDDKAELMGTMGCVTDPLKIDSDGDGLPDGLEQGLTMPGADPGMLPLHCVYGAAVFDTDTSVKTSACNPDSDGDGVQDGAEDANQNGKVDVGELNPNTNDVKLPDGGAGPVSNACAIMNLKPISFHLGSGADIQVALVPEFTEVVQLADAMGNRGIIFYDSTHKVAGIAIDDQPGASTAVLEETSGRGRLDLGTSGAISAPLTQTFTTWDTFSAVRASYDQSGTVDLKARINELATRLGATTGQLMGTAGVNGPFKIQAEYVHRTATRSVILVAITPSAMFNGQTLFTMDDVAGGSAVAQFGDYTGVTCETFDAVVNQKVDFVWAVDDSGSMASSQAAVGRAGSLFAARLATAGLDWRAAAVSAGYDQSNCSPNGCTRAFTNVGATFTGWFTAGGATAFGTTGSATEDTLGSAKKLIQTDLMPKAATGNKIRPDAQVHLIVLGDVDDQSGGQTGQSFLNYFSNFDGAGGMLSKAVTHGIVCPANTNCNDDTNGATVRQAVVVQGTGGVLADIRTFNVANPSAAEQAQQQAVIDAILSTVIGGTGHQLARPPISATIKVAIEPGGTQGTCNTADVPRDRTNGFDFDSASRRLVFYGNCIPSASGKKVAVSYRYWVDGSPDPDGDPCNNTCTAPKACDPGSAMCICPVNCGGACTGTTTCDIASCTCSPGIG